MRHGSLANAPNTNPPSSCGRTNVHADVHSCAFDVCNLVCVEQQLDWQQIMHPAAISMIPDVLWLCSFESSPYQELVQHGHYTQ